MSNGHGSFIKRTARKVGGFINRFARDRRGSTYLFLGITIIPLVGFLGLATDVARGYLVKSRLQYALDAAGLAGARVFYSDFRDDDIRMYFEANFPDDFLGATVDGPTITPSEDGTKLTVTASATVGTTFMQLLQIDTMDVASETEVTRKAVLLEVVLAIDMSGSMNNPAGGSSGTSRIQAAREAAIELVNILYGDDETKELLRIGVVPWNAKVNVTLNGSTFDHSSTTTQVVPTFTHPVTGASQSVVYYANNSPVPLLDAPQSDWRGCVYHQYADDGDDTNDADVHYGPTSIGSSPRKDWMGWEPVKSAEGEPVSGRTWVPGSGWYYHRCSMAPTWGNNECTPCLSHGITPLQSTKTDILDAINELTSPTGYTNIPAGLNWAWHVLMPEAPFTEADAATSATRRMRAIVLLTDGANTGMWGDSYKQVFGTGTGSPPRAPMDARLRALSDNIKSNEVTIYTIQFANSESVVTQLLKDVATGPDSPFYNYAPDADTLSQVFKEVANNLSDLRLSR